MWDGQLTALAKELLEVLDPLCTDLLLGVLGEGLVVVVEELGAVEGLQALEDAEADAAGAEGSDDLAFQVKGVLETPPQRQHRRQ